MNPNNNAETVMRTPKDRLRHTILFEVFLVVGIGPVAALMLGKSLHAIGALTISLSLIAMAANYLYNLAFDYALQRLGLPLRNRGVKLRILHALLFELCLLAFSLPVVMAFLGFSLLQALLLDLGFIVVVPIYAFFFNMAYDHFFPIQS